MELWSSRDKRTRKSGEMVVESPLRVNESEQIFTADQVNSCAVVG